LLACALGIWRRGGKPANINGASPGGMKILGAQ